MVLVPEPSIDVPARLNNSYLEAASVSKHFAGVQALRDVDLRLQQGELVGLIGPNGSGKTTLINILSGLVMASSGTVRLGSLDVTRWPPHKIARAGVNRTFQNIRLFRRLTVLENVAVAATRGQRKEGIGPARRRARLILGTFEIANWADRPAGDLPYGIQRRVELARAIAAGPDFLLLDEPAAGINPVETESVRLWIAG